ncbi:hypothetical protein GMSM_45460 [Geomonas sp. Red276]
MSTGRWVSIRLTNSGVYEEVQQERVCLKEIVEFGLGAVKIPTTPLIPPRLLALDFYNVRIAATAAADEQETNINDGGLHGQGII